MHGVSKNIELLKKTEYLNGFLYGLSIADGKLNQFYARFFLLETRKIHIMQKINDFLKPGGGFKVEKEEKITNEQEVGKRLELDLRNFIIIDPIGDITEVENIAEDRKRYISFKIMDMLEFMEIQRIKSMTIIDATSEIYYARFFVLNIKGFDAVFFFSRKKHTAR